MCSKETSVKTQRIRLTAKRQATLPKSLCEEMHLSPGDSLLVERIAVEGDFVWCLRRQSVNLPTWFGALRGYAQGVEHNMESVRRSVERAGVDGRL